MDRHTDTLIGILRPPGDE